MSNSTEISS